MDSYGQFHKHKNLFVNDSVNKHETLKNPQGTVLTIALRNIDYFLKTTLACLLIYKTQCFLIISSCLFLNFQYFYIHTPLLLILRTALIKILSFCLSRGLLDACLA